MNGNKTSLTCLRLLQLFVDWAKGTLANYTLNSSGNQEQPYNLPCSSKTECGHRYVCAMLKYSSELRYRSILASHRAVDNNGLGQNYRIKIWRASNNAPMSDLFQQNTVGGLSLNNFNGDK